MILEIVEAIIAELEEAGITATADTRNVHAPCCFVNVTKLARPTLGDHWEVTVELLAIVRDLGGMNDIQALSTLVDDTIAALEEAGAAIDTIDTNQQATPPGGGTLPAARIMFTVYSDRS